MKLARLVDVETTVDRTYKLDTPIDVKSRYNDQAERIHTIRLVDRMWMRGSDHAVKVLVQRLTATGEPDKRRNAEWTALYRSTYGDEMYDLLVSLTQEDED